MAEALYAGAGGAAGGPTAAGGGGRAGGGAEGRTTSSTPSTPKVPRPRKRSRQRRTIRIECRRRRATAEPGSFLCRPPWQITGSSAGLLLWSPMPSEPAWRVSERAEGSDRCSWSTRPRRSSAFCSTRSGASPPPSGLPAASRWPRWSCAGSVVACRHRVGIRVESPATGVPLWSAANHRHRQHPGGRRRRDDSGATRLRRAHRAASGRARPGLVAALEARR